MEKERQRYERRIADATFSNLLQGTRPIVLTHQGDTLVLGRLLRDATHGGERVVQFQCHHFKLF